MEYLHRVKKIKQDLICVVETAMACGLDKVKAEELGEVVDMIKDLAEAEEKCIKACYYKEKLEMMDNHDSEEWDEHDEMKRGYNPNRSSRTGRYMSNRSSSRSRGMRGYPMNPDDNRRDVDDRPYDDDGNTMTGGERFGRPYNEYRAMRRNYTESHSEDDKAAMKKHANEHIEDTVSTMKDMWNNSDPELRKKMKSELTTLLSTMN